MRQQRVLSPKASTLPKILKDVFWDYDFAALSLESDRNLIIRRVLTSGNWEAVTWLRSMLGDSAVREWIQTHRGAGMSPQQLRFWELILKLPHGQVNLWLAAEGRGIWDKRGYDKNSTQRS